MKFLNTGLHKNTLLLSDHFPQSKFWCSSFL